MIEPKIPKIIHYCWFGGMPIPEKTQRYIATWQEKCPDYELMRWDESNFDVNSYVYTKGAYENEKWAFVSDVCRLEAVYKYGGVYIDVNTELIRGFDDFLADDGFIGFEQQNMIQMGVFGFKKEHPFVKRLLNLYTKEPIIIDDKDKINSRTINSRTQELLLQIGMIPNNSFQKLKGITVYPKEFFCPRYWNSSRQDPITENTVAIHYYGASWHDHIGKKQLSRKIIRHDRLLRISLIVPVYNVEKYLEDCINSIINQTYSNMEIILVDDGSTDNSGKICDELKKIDSRIKVIHKPRNEGLNRARLTGFEASNGQLVTFVDSDDIIHEGYLATLRYALDETGADIATCGYTVFSDGKPISFLPPADGGMGQIVYEKNKDTMLRWLIIGGAPWNESMHAMTAWGKLYKRHVIEKVDWDMSDFRANEDEIWTMQNFHNAKQGIAVVPDRVYGYRNNQSSITHSAYRNKYKGKILNKFEFIEKLYRISLKYLGDVYNGPLLIRYALETERYIDKYIQEKVINDGDFEAIDRHLPEKMQTIGRLSIPARTRKKLQFISKYGSKKYAFVVRSRVLHSLLF